jgi:biopolymer transport protein ExbD
MAIKKRNKIDVSFSMASMSDMVFLLLIFFMITSTLVAPNALKLLLPQSNNQTEAKPITSISITEDLRYYINDNGKLVQVVFNDIEPFLKRTVHVDDETFIALHADKSVPIEEVVKVMNIAQRNKLKLILATSPEQNLTPASGLFK